MSSSTLPHFFLYGEPQRLADPDFVHVESLGDRSRPNGWNILPHMHEDLSHLMLIATGGGTIRYETDVIAFEAPRLLIVPSGIVHGFDWQRESTGAVLTIADVYLSQTTSRHRELVGLFTAPQCLPLTGGETRSVADLMQHLQLEISWHGLGQSAVVEALMMMILVQAARRVQLPESDLAAAERQSNIVARYRQLVESRFRLRESIEDYARALAVSPTTLREACAASGLSPTAIRDQRALLEAQRLLAYSAMSIAEVGRTIGFPDPAYFSRFFTRKCSESPEAWRRRVLGTAKMAGRRRHLAIQSASIEDHASD